MHPVTAAINAIDKCTAVPGDLGTRITAEAVDQDIPVRPQVKFPTGFQNGDTEKLEACRTRIACCRHSMPRPTILTCGTFEAKRRSK
jgi:hypothetical protein